MFWYNGQKAVKRTVMFFRKWMARWKALGECKKLWGTREFVTAVRTKSTFCSQHDCSPSFTPITIFCFHR